MKRSTAMVDGALAGVAGAGCMSVVRMAARRVGLIDLTPPQATKTWLQKHGVGVAEGSAAHLLDAVIHLGVSATGGAVYGALVEPGRRPPLASGALFGLALWATAFGALAPALGITRSPWRGAWRETAVNVAAHLIYGGSLAVMTGELGRQASGAGARGVRARVG